MSESQEPRVFEVVVRVPLQTQGGEPLGIITEDLKLNVDKGVFAAAGPEETIELEAAFAYGGERYALQLPIEVESLRDGSVRKLILIHPPVTVAPVEVTESTASHDGKGPHLTVTNRRYRTAAGGRIVEAATESAPVRAPQTTKEASDGVDDG